MQVTRSRVGPLDTFSLKGPLDGPHLLALGAVHGNEVCGALALEALIRWFEAGELTLERGQVTFVPICSPDAYAQRRRFNVRNLNRGFGPVTDPVPLVDHCANALCSLMDSADVLLDLHSFRAAGDPFVFLGPENNSGNHEPFSFAREEWSFAQSLGIQTAVHGWMNVNRQLVADQLAFLSLPENSVLAVERMEPRSCRGTTEYFRSLGRGYAVTVECGSNEDSDSVQVAVDAVLGAMTHLDISRTPSAASRPFRRSFRLERAYIREHLDDVIPANFTKFAPLTKGAVLAVRASGQPIIAPCDGTVIFQYPTAHVGDPCIYFAATSDRGT